MKVNSAIKRSKGQIRLEYCVRRYKEPRAFHSFNTPNRNDDKENRLMSTNLVNVKKIYRQIINGVSNKVKCDEMKKKILKEKKLRLLIKLYECICFYNLILEI